MEGACTTCLSVGRQLYVLRGDTVLLRTLLGVDYQIYPQAGGPVCWECEAILLKMQKFRSRAQQAHQFLRSVSINGAPVSNSNCTLSTLGKNTKSNPILKLHHDFDSDSELYTPLVSPAHNYTDFSDADPDELPESLEEITAKVNKKGKVRVRKTSVKKTKAKRKTSIEMELVNKKCKSKLKVTQKRKPKEGIERERNKTKAQMKKKDNSIDNAKCVQIEEEPPTDILKIPRRNMKTKEDMNARFKILKMSSADMLKGRDEDARKSYYVKATYKCKSCLYGYYREKRYLDHMAEMHSENAGPHQCTICKSQFPRAVILQAHVRKHYRRYRCRACGFQNRNIKRMLRHYETQHEIDKDFPCPECDQVFPRYYALRYHKESCHQESTECEYCGKVLSSRTNYRRHVLLHTGMPSRECPVCTKVFRGDELFKSHMRVHRTTPAPDAYCAECDVHFKHVYIYKSHLKNSRKHITPERLKWACSMCDKRFRQQNHLTSHFNSVHLKKTNFVCPHCEKNISTKSALRAHVRTVHERVPVKKDKVCDICARTFATKSILQNHIRTHTGERPFICAICNASFGHSSALWTHNKLVHLKLKRGERVPPGTRTGTLNDTAYRKNPESHDDLKSQRAPEYRMRSEYRVKSENDISEAPNADICKSAPLNGPAPVDVTAGAVTSSTVPVMAYPPVMVQDGDANVSAGLPAHFVVMPAF